LIVHELIKLNKSEKNKNELLQHFEILNVHQIND